MEQTYIYALGLKDGTALIGEHVKPGKKIPEINSGLCGYPAQCIQKIIGIKEVNETRSLESTVDVFSKNLGADRVQVVKGSVN